MTVELPAGAPPSIGEAFAQINAVDALTVDHLKVMVPLEAAGQEPYRNMATGTDHEGVIAILEHNGREELASARTARKRSSTAIG
jgi:hypothetical protein